MVLALGTSVSRCGEAVLRCIEETVKQYERDKRAGNLQPAMGAQTADNSTPEKPHTETTAAAGEHNMINRSGSLPLHTFPMLHFDKSHRFPR